MSLHFFHVRRVVVGVGIGAFLGLVATAGAQTYAVPPPAYQQSGQQQMTAQQRAQMLWQSLQASQAQLRNYEWIETVAVSVDGEQKSTTTKRCYFGVDGTLQKVTLGQTTTEGSHLPGVLPIGMLVKRVEANRKKEMTEFIERAVALLKDYLPPDPALVQRSVQSGALGVQVLDPNSRVQLNFGNYFQPGDNLGADIALPGNNLLGFAVSTYVDTPANPVMLNVTMANLPDGTLYAPYAVMTASSRNLVVTVSNGGYRPLGQTPSY